MSVDFCQRVVLNDPATGNATTSATRCNSGDIMKILAKKNCTSWLGLPLLAMLLFVPVHAQSAPSDTDVGRADASASDTAEDGQATPQSETAQAGNADQKATTLKEVTVTAEYRVVPLKTAPISATVLSGDELSKLGVDLIDQLQFVTPSTTINNFGLGNDFNIRGIGKGEHNTQTTTGVITVFDGVATFPGFATQGPFYDISSLQILRGPQGTFGGQNAIGGALLVTSNDPIIDGGHQGYIQGQVGNYSDMGAQGAINLPISSTLAARVAFYGDNRDSFYDISGPWTGTNARQRIRSGRVGLLWEPNDAWSVLLKTEYNHLDMGATPADPVNSPNDIYDISSNAEQEFLVRFMRSTLQASYKLANGTELRSITGYQKNSIANRSDLDGTDIGLNTFETDSYETIKSQEFSLISPDTDRFAWILGAYWQEDTFLFPEGAFLIDAPTGSIFPPGSPYNQYRVHGITPKRDTALFAHASYELTDDLKLEAGGRYAKSKATNDITITQFGTVLPIQQTAEFTNFSGKVSLGWTLNDRNFFYGFVATGFKPGGLNAPVTLEMPEPFDAEKVLTTEIGWKAEWLGDRVRTQLNAYNNRYENFQVMIGYPLFPTFGIELNTPNPTRIYGVEAQVQADFGDWSTFANLGWMRSSLGQFYATDPRAPSFLPCDPATGPASMNCTDLAGRDQTYAPDLTYSFGLQRTFRVGNDTIIPRINYAHVSSQWATLFENVALGDRVGSRNMLSAQLSWNHGSMMTTLYGTNLTDQHYISAINSGLRFAGAPRQYGIRFIKFF